MQSPTLIIMAAGMGSRFGGLKQITPVDDAGHILMDYSLYDAWQAGFRRVAFVVKAETEAEFRRTAGRRAERRFQVLYVHQRLEDLPAGFSVPEGRIKPWGTAHAVRACREVVDGPFAIINADDFYGPGAFSAVYGFLTSPHPETEHAMVAYRLRNTVTEHGSVARGVCQVRDGYLTGITERTSIVCRHGETAWQDEDGRYHPLAGDTPVSMNLWGFSQSMMDALDRRFADFLTREMPGNPMKAEYFLPGVVSAQMAAGQARIRVLPCEETWYGVTYREDLPGVQAAVAGMRERGQYPPRLWD